jgi:hypothetical protein
MGLSPICRMAIPPLKLVPYVGLWGYHGPFHGKQSREE